MEVLSDGRNSRRYDTLEARLGQPYSFSRPYPRLTSRVLWG
jgi:hypothetical protein